MRNIKFPKNFLWGSSISAYQTEGGNIKSDYECWGRKKGIEVAGEASDHYNRFKEDITIAEKLYQNSFRISIEWARIESQKGSFNKQELEHYREVLKEVRKKGMKSVVTLFHFTLPNWLAESGGWENEKSVNYFERYVCYTIKNLGELIDYIVTINEPFIYCLHAFMLEDLPPGEKSIFKMFKVLFRLIKVHKLVYKRLKSKSDALIGYSKNVPYIVPYRKRNIFDRFIAKFLDFLFNKLILVKLSKYSDFIGLQYYNRVRIQFKIRGDHLSVFNEWGIERVEKNRKVTDMKWEIYPEGIYHVLKKLGKYNLPILITENGLADSEDKYRKDFIRDHLINIRRAISKGVEVIGYLHWSLLDNFEWKEGKSKRFGLVEIDYNHNFRRSFRYSSKYYAEICRRNEIVET